MGQLCVICICICVCVFVLVFVNMYLYLCIIFHLVDEQSGPTGWPLSMCSWSENFVPLSFLRFSRGSGFCPVQAEKSMSSAAKARYETFSHNFPS